MGSVQLRQQAKELRHDRVTEIEAARAILDKAETEKRNLTTEEQSEYDKRTAAAGELKTRYERLESQYESEAELAEATERAKDLAREEGRDPNGADITEAQTAAQRVKELRSSDTFKRAFVKYIQRGEKSLSEAERAALNHPELRAQTIGTDTAGGYVTSTDTHDSIAVALESEVAMREASTVIPFSSDRNIPVVNDDSDLGDNQPRGEGTGYQEDDVTLANRVLGAFKLTRMVRASEELVMDDDAGFIGMLPGFIARRFAPVEEGWFVNGTGSGQPRGVMLDAPLGVTAAGASAITADELKDLKYSVRRPYRKRASWLMNDSTALAIDKLKDGDGQYIWRAGVEVGDSDILLGAKVRTSDQVAALGTGNKSLAYGDFSYYWIADRGARAVKRLDERYAELGQVGFLAMERIDGVLTITEAVKHLVHP